MSIKTACPHCERAYTLADAQRGKTVRCTACRATFQVREEDPARAEGNGPVLAEVAVGRGATASATAAADPGVQTEDEIAFSRSGLLKALLWVIGWQSICFLLAVGLPILIVLALRDFTLSVKSVTALIMAALGTVVGVCGLLVSVANWRLFLGSTIPSSSHYRIGADRLQRYSRRGDLVEDIPFANIASVRLVTRRVREVWDDPEVSPDATFKILRIQLHNTEHGSTRLDHQFLRWSQKMHKADVALIQDFFGDPLKTVSRKIKKRWKQWKATAGQPVDAAEPDVTPPSPQPWYLRPVVLVPSILGVVGLCGLVWLLSVLLSSSQRPEAVGPNANLAGPGPVGPKVKKGGPGPVDPNPKQEGPEKAAPKNGKPQPIQGLLAYWPLDEGEGPFTHDKLGTIPGLRMGGEWVQGVKGTALRLNGTTDFVDLRADGRLNFGPGGPFTLSGWARTEAEGGVIGSFRKRKGFGVINVGVLKGNLRGWVRDDTSGFGGVQLTGGPVNDGKWHHFALARQPDGTVELFLDGVSQGKERGKSTGGPITTDQRALGSDRFVAAAGKKGPPNFAGTIDEVRLYNRALTPTEVGLLAGKKD
jgi:hypothetical protein